MRLPVLQAPHRLPFLTGALGMVLAMLWWLLWLPGSPASLSDLSAPGLYSGWTHAWLMQYLVLPPLIWGFLLTVCPRWMGLPEVPRAFFTSFNVALLLTLLLAITGASVWAPAMTLAGLLSSVLWLAGLCMLGYLLVIDDEPVWHAWSAFLALIFGLLGTGMFAAHLIEPAPRLVFASIKIGTFGFLLPLFFTVLHRMVPFFCSRVIPDYEIWRPRWLLAAVWIGCLAHLTLELSHRYALLWLVDLPLMLLFACVLIRWWPGRRGPRLLQVLLWAIPWLPVAMLLYAVQSIIFAQTGNFELGRGPAHALFIGFFGSIIIAMVTRVSQGHSGRPLELPTVAWIAFLALQPIAVGRIIGAATNDDPLWQFVVAALWVIVWLPWCWRIVRITSSPRIDNKPG